MVSQGERDAQEREARLTRDREMMAPATPRPGDPLPPEFAEVDEAGPAPPTAPTYRDKAIGRIAGMLREVHVLRCWRAEEASRMVGRLEVAPAPDWQAEAESMLDDEIVKAAEGRLMEKLGAQLERLR